MVSPLVSEKHYRRLKAFFAFKSFRKNSSPPSPATSRSTMNENYVLEHHKRSSKNLDYEAASLINYVKGEVEDEDGDWATGFIAADPPPGHSALSRPDGSSSSSSSSMTFTGGKQLFPAESDAYFICQMCSSYLNFELLGPELDCGCLVCLLCLQKHVEVQLLLSHTRSHNRSQAMENGDLIPQVNGSISCPCCLSEAALSHSALQILAPDACKVLEEAATHMFLESGNYIRCPGCHVMVEKIEGDIPPGVAPSGVPEFDRTVPFTELDDQGKPLSRKALLDKYSNYYRCSMCKVGFCGLCMKMPYHLGYTCSEYDEFQKAKRCIYCDTAILKQPFEDDSSSINIRNLKKHLDKQNVDTTWCVEKSELLSVLNFASSVCNSSECVNRLHSACTRTHSCGHHCGGVRAERTCLPCLEEGCQENTLSDKRNALPSADDWCTICMVEPLRGAPSIQLKCGHIVHFDCAKKKINEGFPGPQITFGYLHCPQCSEFMEHESLTSYLQKPFQLMTMVKERALRRLKIEKLDKRVLPAEHQTFALNRYNFYLCCKCNLPYYGGNRDCRLVNNEGRNEHNPLELVCGGCSAAADEGMTCKKGHGTKYIEYKCRYCCSVATFFCFGKTHFCNGCHLSRPDGNPHYVPPPCQGPDSCPLKVAHAPNGQEFCLGCSMCRILSQ